MAKKTTERDLLKNVRVEIQDEKNYPYRLILGKEGRIHKEPMNYHVILQLTDGVMQQIGTKREQKMEEFFQMQFKTCTIDLNAHKLKNGPLDIRGASNVSSIKDLALQIQNEKAQKMDTRGSEVEFNKKFSLPFSALAFAFIGIPLGLMARTGSLLSSVLAVLLVAIYDGFIIFGENGGPMGLMSPFWAMWLPNFVLISVGLVMAYWLNHRLDFWRSLFRRAEIK